jgi:hypothetical protein
MTFTSYKHYRLVDSGQKWLEGNTTVGRKVEASGATISINHERSFYGLSITNFMEHSPWEVKRYPASHKIPKILWNTKVLCHVHNSPSLVPILSHMNPLHTFTSYLFKIHFDINLPFMPRSSKWSLSFGFYYRSLACISTKNFHSEVEKYRCLAAVDG